jgi:hypothetical protein
VEVDYDLSTFMGRRSRWCDTDDVLFDWRSIHRILRCHVHIFDFDVTYMKMVHRVVPYRAERLGIVSTATARK